MAASATSRKPIIGLAGGIGSGKTTVAGILAELGAAVISSDALNREELDDPGVVDRLCEWFGESIRGADGRVNRAVLRRLIADDREARARMESLLHPRVEERRRRIMAEVSANPRVRAIVWDSPLLYETGLDARCDRVVFVEADDAVRAARVRERGWTPADLKAFEAAQKPLDFKRASADHRVVNNSDVVALRRQVEEIFSRILSGA